MSKVDYKDIVIGGKILRYYGNAQKPSIKERTESGGWKIYCHHESKRQIDIVWKRLLDDQDEGKEAVSTGASMVIRDKTAPAKTDTLSVLDDRFMKDLTEEVAEFNSVGARLAELTLRIGLRLEFVKGQLKHGQFEDWVKANVDISLRHARRCRQLAEAFIGEQKIHQGDALALIDPSKAKKLEQLVFGFIGDDTQAELFAKYGIGVKQPNPKGDHCPVNQKKLKPGETLAHHTASECLGMVQHGIFLYMVEEKTSQIQHLDVKELKQLLDTVKLAKTAIEDQIKAG